MAEKLTLASMCAGGVQERIDRALAKISDNILDLNTDAKKKRTLDIKIVLTPSEDDREDVAVEVQTSVKLAPEMGLKTQLFINKDFRSGVTTLTEHARCSRGMPFHKRRLRGLPTISRQNCSDTQTLAEQIQRNASTQPRNR